MVPLALCVSLTISCTRYCVLAQLIVTCFSSSVCDQDEAVIKTSWVTQMQKAKERPNLVHWRDELVAITKDNTEDFEEATLSVELMRVRCDVCYHEKSVSSTRHTRCFVFLSCLPLSLARRDHRHKISCQAI